MRVVAGVFHSLSVWRETQSNLLGTSTSFKNKPEFPSPQKTKFEII
jgi:hypothetical protein